MDSQSKVVRLSKPFSYFQEKPKNQLDFPQSARYASENLKNLYNKSLKYQLSSPKDIQELKRVVQEKVKKML